jgi:hypothetical protein
VIVSCLFAVKVDGGGARGFGVGGHLELFVGGRLKLGADQDGSRDDEEQESKAH